MLPLEHTYGLRVRIHMDYYSHGKIKSNPMFFFFLIVLSLSIYLVWGY